jgi:hypothetical protein
MAAKPKNPAEAVAQIRTRIADLKQQRRALTNAPVSKAEAEAAIDHHLADAAARYQGVIDRLAQRGELHSLAAGDEPEAFAAFMFADPIKARLMAAVEPRLANGLDAGERARQITEMDQRIRAAEREEENPIAQAEADSLAITRRSDANPRIVLGLDTE